MRSAILASLAILVLLAGCISSPPAGASAPSQAASLSANAADLEKCISGCDAWPESANACKIGCQTKAAQESKDASRCDLIKSMPGTCEMFYATCLGAVAGELRSEAPCERTANSTGRDWCIVTSANKIGDPAVCDKILDATMKSACRGSFVSR